MLTDLKIRNIKPLDKTKRYADRDGLVLEVRPSGKKVFIFRFQLNKKPQTITLGRYPGVSLAEARQKVSDYQVLLQKGIDPRPNQDNKFRHIAERWHEKNKTKWKDVTRNRHAKSIARDINPFIGDSLIDEITKVDILQIIKPYEVRGCYDTAHRLYARLKDIFEFAVGASLTANYPFIGLKKALTAQPRAVNQPAISPYEAHELLNTIKNSKVSRINKLYLEVLAHLFTRPSELRLAEWKEFDLQNAEWQIPVERMKMAAPHWVPLSPQVVTLLKELRLITGFTPYLFNSPTLSKHKPMSEASARKLLHTSGYKNRHTLHGFRSLASSVLHEQSSFRTDAIEAQLAHKVQGVRGVYLRADFKQERRELMNWYSDWLTGTNSNIMIQIL